jgi:hypothetical protein
MSVNHRPEDNRITWDGKHQSYAEKLLDLAEAVKKPAGVVICVENANMGPDTLSRVQTALKLAEMPPVIRMRAILEDWDMYRIVKEVY